MASEYWICINEWYSVIYFQYFYKCVRKKGFFPFCRRVDQDDKLRMAEQIALFYFSGRIPVFRHSRCGVRDIASCQVMTLNFTQFDLIFAFYDPRNICRKNQWQFIFYILLLSYLFSDDKSTMPEWIVFKFIHACSAHAFTQVFSVACHFNGKKNTSKAWRHSCLALCQKLCYSNFSFKYVCLSMMDEILKQIQTGCKCTNCFAYNYYPPSQTNTRYMTVMYAIKYYLFVMYNKNISDDKYCMKILIHCGNTFYMVDISNKTSHTLNSGSMYRSTRKKVS